MSNAQQNSAMVQASQANSSRATADSSNPVNGIAFNSGSIWPPLNAFVTALEDWSTSNREQAISSNNNECVENRAVGATKRNITPASSVGVHLLGSGAPIFSANRNPMVGTAVTPSGNQSEKRMAETAGHLLRYTFITPQLLGPSTVRHEGSVDSEDSRRSSQKSRPESHSNGFEVL